MNVPRAKPAFTKPTAEAMREHAADAAGLLRALGNEQRLMILCHLLSGERAVGALQAELPLSQSALSQHLAVLREAGLVDTRRQSQQILYSLVPGPAEQVLATLQTIYCPTGESP